jgi:hypothetical protein
MRARDQIGHFTSSQYIHFLKQINKSNCFGTVSVASVFVGHRTIQVKAGSFILDKLSTIADECPSLRHHIMDHIIENSYGNCK